KRYRDRAAPLREPPAQEHERRAEHDQHTNGAERRFRASHQPEANDREQGSDVTERERAVDEQHALLAIARRGLGYVDTKHVASHPPREVLARPDSQVRYLEPV